MGNEMWQHIIRVGDRDHGPGRRWGAGEEGDVKHYLSGIPSSVLPKGMYRADSPVIGVYTDTGEPMDPENEDTDRPLVALPVEMVLVDKVPDRGPCLTPRERHALVKSALAQVKLQGYAYAHSVIEQRLYPERPGVTIRVRAAKLRKEETSNGGPGITCNRKC